MKTTTNVPKKASANNSKAKFCKQSPDEKVVLRMLQPKKNKPVFGLSIHCFKLKEWLDKLNVTSGIYFLNIDALNIRNRYSIHYKCHITGELIEFDDRLKGKEDPKKEFLEALILDLSVIML